MKHYGTLRDFRFSDKDADDIRGQNVYGIDDEKLGDIDDVIFDHSTGDIEYVVVDTGGWLSSNKFLIPADRLQPSREHEEDYYVNLTKDQVKTFPAYDEKTLEDRDRWDDYEKRYEAGWTTEGDVQHRADAPDKNLTPTTDEMVASGIASRGGAASRREFGGDVTDRNNLGEHWTNFESRIRRDRAAITGGCGACRIDPGSVGGANLNRKVG